MNESRRDRRRRTGSRRRVALSILLAAVVAGAVSGVGLALRDDRRPAAARSDDESISRRLPSTTSASSATTTTVAAPPTTVRGPLGSGQPVSFAFGGDVHFEGALRSKLLADPQGVLAPIAPTLSAADVSVVNLESAITEGGQPQPKRFTFRAPPLALAALAAAGIDTATIANNHGLDFGPQGLEDTLASEQFTGFDLIGIGRNAAEAYAPHRMDVKGQRISIIAATQVIDSQFIATWTATDTQPGLASAKEVDRLVAAVQAARADSDTVVVFLHWGVEGETCPTADQQTLARQLVDAGADIVVGSHAHRQVGGGRLGSAFVDYGLGNFVFYNESGPSGTSGVLMVTATGRQIDGYSWLPAQIRGGVPQVQQGPPAEQAVGAWNALRGCTGLAP